MHSLHIAHKYAPSLSPILFSGLTCGSSDVKCHDILWYGMMMDATPLYGTSHPGIETKKSSSRTLHPVKYYLTDLSHAHQYGPDGPYRKETGYGWDYSVPEFMTQQECDPFAVDVYRLGNVFREELTEVRLCNLIAFASCSVSLIRCSSLM